MLEAHEHHAEDEPQAERGQHDESGQLQRAEHDADTRSKVGFGTTTQRMVGGGDGAMPLSLAAPPVQRLARARAAGWRRLPVSATAVPAGRLSR